MTTTADSAVQVLPTYLADQRVTQARVLRSEWTKLRSLPSTSWSLLTAVVLIVGGFLPSAWTDPIYKYLALPAGTAVTNVRHDPMSLGPWAGFGLFCLYTAIVLGLAAWQLHRRDA